MTPTLLRYIVAAVIGFLIGLLIGFKSCSSSPVFLDKWRYDTVYVDKPALEKSGKTRVIYRVISGDTVYVPIETLASDTAKWNRLVIEGDTLKMQDSALIVPRFRTDSLTFNVWYKPPREKIVTITHEIQEKKDFSLGFGIIAGATMENNQVVLRYGIGISITKKLWDF